jgi:hypothetical protein
MAALQEQFTDGRSISALHVRWCSSKATVSLTGSTQHGSVLAPGQLPLDIIEQLLMDMPEQALAALESAEGQSASASPR